MEFIRQRCTYHTMTRHQSQQQNQICHDNKNQKDMIKTNKPKINIGFIVNRLKQGADNLLHFTSYIFALKKVNT